MNRFKEQRKKAGFKRQSDLAKILFVNQTAVSQWERGVTTPSAPTLLKLSSLYGVTTDYLLGRDDTNRPGASIRVPVLRAVTAGFSIEAAKDVVGYEELDAGTAATGEFFGLCIKGSSMEPRIKDGDVVIARRQEDANTGDTVVVTVNGNAAEVKRIKKESDGSLWLLPNDPAYDPQHFSAAEVASKPVRILGKVMELRGKF